MATPAVAAGGKTIRAAFVYTGPINDHGWTNAHDDGRKALEQALGSSVETAYTENVPETADSQRVFEDYARKGYDIIYGTSFGFMDYMLEAAKSFPNVKFDHCSGFKTAPNMATYYAAEEEPRYVSGMIAGKMTKTNTLGFVGSFPIPEVVRFLNAFAAGVQATNPDAKIHVVWINTWFDPPKEKSGAESVLDLNADVLTRHDRLALAGPGRGGAQQIRDGRRLRPVVVRAAGDLELGPLHLGAALHQQRQVGARRDVEAGPALLPQQGRHRGSDPAEQPGRRRTWPRWRWTPRRRSRRARSTSGKAR